METPIEIARRVWPGEWVAESGFLRLDLCAPAQLPLCMWVRLYADDFVVELSTPSVWRLQASRPDLAEALTIARAKVAESITELAHGVGLATFTPTTDKDAAIVAEITAERVRSFAKWGPQPHPWAPASQTDHRIANAAIDLESAARKSMYHEKTWSAIVGEEAGEALRERIGKMARPELIQLAATIFGALAECPDLQEVES